MSEDEYQQKLGYFVKAHIRYAKSYPLRPINRPHAIEKATASGLVQKALELKKRR